MSTRPELIGSRFGRLVVVAFAGSRPRANTSARYWVCQCDCGARIEAKTSSLRTGNTGSCGCARREYLKAKATHGHTAGHRFSPTYSKWAAMIARCTNPSYKAYSRYGGRGISVCERWKSFENFLADMGEAPDGMSIDRVDNDGNYDPGNCRWATRLEQARNTSANTRLTLRGETLTLVEWSERLGIGRDTIMRRLRKGWPMERVLGTRLYGRWGPVREGLRPGSRTRTAEARAE